MSTTINGHRDGILKVSTQVILEALHLPKDTKVIDLTFDGENNTANFLVEHDQLPCVPIGQPAPEIGARFRHRAPDEMVEFLGWYQ